MTKTILLLGDSCTGTVPRHMDNLQSVVDVATDLVERHGIETGFFLGDQVMGYCDADTLREQWREFETGPISRLRDRLKNYRQIASNHVCYDDPSSKTYEDFCGPAEWTATIDGVQYLALNTAQPVRGGDAGIDCDRLERRLKALDPDLPIVVMGHHPIWPINGYDRAPLWMVPADEGQRAWALLLEYGVELYACSHIIAFDVQLHDGLLQVCTGGAGTEYGPNGAMPGPVEGLHVLIVKGIGTDRLELRRVPASDTPAELWQLSRTDHGWAPHRAAGRGEDNPGYLVSIDRPAEFPARFAAYAEQEGPPALSLELSNIGLNLRMVPTPGADPLTWSEDLPPSWEKLRLEIQTRTGPGGVVLSTDRRAFSSLKSSSSRGLEQFRALSVPRSSEWSVVEFP